MEHFRYTGRARRRLIMLFAGLLLGSASVSACKAQSRQQAEAVVKLVSDALRSGDAALLAELSDTQVILDLTRKAAVYSRAQSRFVFEMFFDEHPPSRLTTTATNVLGDQCSVRGRYFSLESNQVWDFSLRFKSHHGRWVMKEMRLSRSLPSTAVSPAP